MTDLRRAAAGMAALEEYALRDSALNRIHPRAKILSAAAYIVCAASFPSARASGLAAFVFYPAILLALTDIPLGAIAKRIIPVLPFALFGGIGNIVFMRETAFVFSGVVVTKGVVSCAAILLKAVFCASAVLLLVGTTPFHVICAELRRLRVPAVFCVQLNLMYRYISVLIHEASAMHDAYTLRTAQPALKMKDTGFFLGQLVVKSMDRAERVYNAMKCRGFSGAFFARQRNMNALDYFFCAAVCAAVIFLRLFNLARFLGAFAV
ncbi:MAG: cobalt ECF transporter T component CbiQ [Treponemataceae bacterium]|nr:MAG: cobalt ECF transporter T component CbiQ [Treponemataceae bacterium]